MRVSLRLHKRRTKSVLVLEPFQPPGAAAARCLDSAAAPWQGAVKHRASNEGPHKESLRRQCLISVLNVKVFVGTFN